MAGMLLWLWARQIALRREAYIRSSVLPRGLFDQLRKRHPELTVKECQLVAQALRQFFLAHLKSGRKYVSMPSQIADELWHEFILYTKNYQAFCNRAFGRFLHHTPALALRRNQGGNVGLRRCWWYACREENINPRIPARLPLLFALDAKLNVPNGFHYAPNCRPARGQETGASGAVIYCGGDFCSPDVDGSVDGFGDGGGGSGDWGGDGGGDGSDGGGDSCGGGGCGGS